MIRYFAFSSGLHALALLVALFFFSGSSGQVSATYTIDFIGSGKVVATTGQETAKKAAPKPAAKPKEKATNRKAYTAKSEIAAKPKPQRKPKPLATPSILNEEKTNPSADDNPNAFGGGDIKTDFANFPYPWYITQVRNSLWIEWEKRRPVGSTLGTLVTFVIVRNGNIKNLKTARKSGDDAFDFAATSSVMNAGPFPPLPMYYEKDELSITVEFKQEQ